MDCHRPYDVSPTNPATLAAAWPGLTFFPPHRTLSHVFKTCDMSVSFTDRELDIMAVLWERGPSTVAEVHEALGEDIAYKTVLTMLRVLEQKGHITHTEEGRAHRFKAAVKREDAGATAVDRLLDKLFGGSEELLLTQLVTRRPLSADEVKRLRRKLDDSVKKRGRR